MTLETKLNALKLERKLLKLRGVINLSLHLLDRLPASANPERTLESVEFDVIRALTNFDRREGV